MNAVIAIDVGTSSTRAALVDASLAIKSLGSAKYPLLTPVPGWAEQDPAEVMHALETAIASCLAQAPAGVTPKAIVLDTALHSLIALDQAFEPLTNIITWADMRSADQARRFADDRLQTRALYERTGCPPHAMYFPAKVAWLKEHEPQILNETAALTSIKGYALHHLTGRLVEDSSIASGSGLFNIEQLEWDQEALKIAGVSADLLPETVEPKTVIGQMRPELSRKLGIDPIPVVAGGSDGPFANVGAGCVEDGDMAITVGTSSAVRMFTRQPRVDRAARTWCYYLGDATWTVGGAINGGGSSLDWLVKSFPQWRVQDKGANQTNTVHQNLDALAQDVPAGSEGLLFAPYLAGERNPGLRADARGYMVGLGLHHSDAHFVRATMEGIAYQIAWVYQSVAEVAGTPEKIRITGGFVDSAVWPQILADVLGRELEIPTEKEGSLIGAAAFGHAAIDSSVDWRSLAGEIQVQSTITPNMDNHRHYQEVFGVYQRVYQALAPEFSTIQTLSGSDSHSSL